MRQHVAFPHGVFIASPSLTFCLDSLNDGFWSESITKVTLPSTKLLQSVCFITATERIEGCVKHSLCAAGIAPSYLHITILCMPQAWKDHSILFLWVCLFKSSYSWNFAAFVFKGLAYYFT